MTEQSVSRQSVGDEPAHPGLDLLHGAGHVLSEALHAAVLAHHDVVVREDGSVERLTQDVPRTVEEVEAWVSGLIA